VTELIALGAFELDQIGLGNRLDESFGQHRNVRARLALAERCVSPFALSERALALVERCVSPFALSERALALVERCVPRVTSKRLATAVVPL
jgi:hypothetical protein